MLNSEDEAYRLSGDDKGSWSARGRAKKAYRHMPALPDEEAPRHRRSRKNRKKHVHKWGEWIKEGEAVRYSWAKPRHRYTIIKWVRTCKKCGHRDRGQSAAGGGPIRTVYYLYW